MSKELIECPDVEEIKSLIAFVQEELVPELEEEPELAQDKDLLLKVVEILGEKIKIKDKHALSDEQKIDIAAHLFFLQELIEDFISDEFEDEDFEEGEEEEHSH